MIANDRNLRQLLDCQRKGLAATKNRITRQQHDRPGESSVTFRFEVPGLYWSKVIFAGAELCSAVKGNSPTVAKPTDDRNRSIIVSARAVTNIDDNTV